MYRFSPVHSDKLDFYALSGIMETIVLLLAGWGGQTGWEDGGMDVPTLVLYISVFLSLSLEVRQVVGSGIFYHLHWCCGRRGVFLLVRENNNNTLHTNTN